MKLDKVLYTAHATVAGGRTGTARSSDGALDVSLSTPRELGGPGGAGTNPEQLFAAGYSACFLGAMKVVAARQKISLPADTAVTGSVGIGPVAAGFGLQAELKVSLPEMDRETAEALVKAAHQVCPYSNATRGNIHVGVSLV
ncbi:MAG TPA: organic hydroperoxide resistance protein [Burkholderiaceae bacterium]|nr:organic hydroperoxide resistance protein [Burkholderiaceae bacterium]